MTPRALASCGAVALGLVVFVACERRSPPDPAPPTASAAPVEPPPGPVEVTFRSGAYLLRGHVMRPAGRGPFPALVYNHGSEQDPSIAHFADLGRYFQAAGYVAFFPYRRGAGGSEGPYWENEVQRRPAAEREIAVVEQLEAQSDDVVAALSWIGAQPYVDGKRVAVAGCSFGGIETMLTAARQSVAYAAVDFAGASMSWTGSAPLRDRLKSAARAARIPVFFVQAENDFNTEPSVALSAEMDAVHKPHMVQIFPPHGATPMAGHAHFCIHGMEEWGPNVLAFLREPPAM